MASKPTYEELEQRIRELEGQIHTKPEKIEVSGINIEWDTDQGKCTFEELPVAMMWIDTTLAGLMSGIQAMVGTERFALALQSEGRKSVEEDWRVISQFSNFGDGFKAIANIAAVGGWGEWELVSLDENQQQCIFRIRNSWEARYQKALGINWGSGMLAGKMAGYSSKLFKTNCWAEQKKFIAKGDQYDEFIVIPSARSIETEIENLLATDEATKADMAVALQKLQKEIDERIRADEALRESEEKYRLLVENIPSVTWITSENGETTYISPNVEKIYGFTQEEIYAEGDTLWLGRIHPDDIDQVKGFLKRVFEEKTKWDIEYRIQRKDGKWIWIHDTAIMAYEEGGEKHAFGLFSDITEPKQAEEELRREKAFTDMALSSQLDTFFLFEPATGKALRWNQTFKEISGFSDEEITGKPAPASYYSPEDLIRAEAFIQKVLVEGMGTIELELICKNGRKVPTEYRASVINDAQNNPKYIISIGRDIADRVQAEKNRLILETRLREAQKMEAIATLAGGIAHQFNNALSPVLGGVDLIEMAVPKEHGISQHIKNIRSSAYKMSNLTNQLLAYARGGQYQPRNLSMSSFIRDTLPITEAGLNPNIDIETDLPNDLLSINADMTQMQMVLSAILSNASEAMHEQGRIRITCRNEVITDGYNNNFSDIKSGQYIYLKIEDDGEGMDKETLAQVFDPFFTTKVPGRGLGMAAAYGIIKNHNGLILVDSELGKGTSVHIYLPASDALQQEETAIISHQEMDLNNVTILVIEDEAPVMEMIVLLLETMGFRILKARSGAEAIDILERYSGNIDLVLLDIKLPDMDGDKIFPIIKKSKPDIKVIVCSGYSVDGPAQKLLDAGAEAFMQKPFSLKELQSKMREVLKS